jgi:hypothetical protein
MLRRVMPLVLAAWPLLGACADFPFEFGDLPVCDTLDTEPVCKDIYGTSTGDLATSGDESPTTEIAGEATSTSSGGVDWTSHGDETSGGEPDAPGLARPFTASLTAWPTSQVKLPGPVQLLLNVEGPADRVDLYDSDAPLLLDAWPAVDLHVLQVTSSLHPGNGVHPLRAVVHADDGRVVEATLDLEIAVPPGGSQDWMHTLNAQLSAYTSAAMLGPDLAVAGYIQGEDGVKLAVARLDTATGAVLSGPRILGDITWSGEARGPVLATAPDGAVYVAATRPLGDTITRILYKLRMDGPEPTLEWGLPVTGDQDESVHAIAFLGDTVALAGAVRTHANPPRYDLRVGWLSTSTGDLHYLRDFAAPADDDLDNELSEQAHGLAVAHDELVVVGTREVKLPNKLEPVTRTVVLRYGPEAQLLGEWTSPGDLNAEDGALAVAALAGGGFAVTGWTREPAAERQVLTRAFAADGAFLWSRLEPTPGFDAVGHALAEDLEGKLVIAGSRERPYGPKQDPSSLDAWIFAAPGPFGARTWEVFHAGVSNGPDEAFALVLDDLGYAHPVGATLLGLEIHAFALRLFP